LNHGRQKFRGHYYFYASSIVNLNKVKSIVPCGGVYRVWKDAVYDFVEICVLSIAQNHPVCVLELGCQFSFTIQVSPYFDLFRGLDKAMWIELNRQRKLRQPASRWRVA
jgi:hypothetical protein